MFLWKSYEVIHPKYYGISVTNRLTLMAGCTMPRNIRCIKMIKQKMQEHTCGSDCALAMFRYASNTWDAEAANDRITSISTAHDAREP